MMSPRRSTEGELACELGADGGSALSAFASTSGGVSGVLRVCAAELEFHLKELRNTKPGAVRPTLCEPSRHGTAGMPTATAPAERLTVGRQRASGVKVF